MQKKLTIAIVAVIVIVLGIWLVLRKDVSAPESLLPGDNSKSGANVPVDESLGASIYSNVEASNPANKLPETNPFKNADTNPLKGAYENPFE